MEDDGRAVPFIQIKEEVEEGSKKKEQFIVNDDAFGILKSFGEKKMAVLVISGPQRSGKSFLANRILKRFIVHYLCKLNRMKKGFAIGPSTNPCTKGINFIFF